LQALGASAALLALDSETILPRPLKGVVAKKCRSLYRPGERGWIKVKNPAYWRRDAERCAMARGRAQLESVRAATSVVARTSSE
jgi:ATP-dependent DNA ligase